jgi:N-methylhydantoinase B
MVMPPKQRNIVIRPGDVFEVYAGGAGGYGDPLEREPEAVLKDVSNSEISIQAASKLYGVIVNEKIPELDPKAVEKVRRQIITERIGPLKSFNHGTKDSNNEIMIAEYLSIQKVDGLESIICRKCGQSLCNSTQSYKQGCLTCDIKLSETNLLIDDELQSKYIDEKVVFRMFFCPSCGVNIENEICRETDEHLFDIEISIFPKQQNQNGAK